VRAHYEKDVTGNVATSYYSAGGQRIAMRVRTNSTNVVYYLHSDHLGSTSLATCGSGSACGGNGAEISGSRTWYKPYGELRAGGSTLPTDRRYTGQRWEAGLGLYDYGARYYDPLLGRFLSADSIVPGAATSVGGGAATLGYSEQTRLTPLTVGFHETQFLDILNTENRELLQFGPPALWSDKVRQEHVAPMGPANPQVLNRYAYCLGNPLRYVDPTGHYLVNNINVKLTANEVADLLSELDFWISLGDSASDWHKILEFTGVSLELLAFAGMAVPEVSAPTGALMFVAGAGLDFTLDDLKALRYELALAAGAERSDDRYYHGARYTSYKCANGVHLKMGSNVVYWGIEIDGREVIGHWDILPQITWKGTWNGTRIFMMAWYIGDYGR